MNRKIKNAQESSYNGILFRSKSEMNIYKLFFENGFTLEYEPKKAVIMEEFNVNFDFYDHKSDKNNKVLVNKKDKTILPITYTPDFIYKGKRRLYIIEVKGFANDTFPLKKKLFLKLLNEKENHNFAFVMLYNLTNAKQLIEIIKKEENGNEQQP